MIYRAPEYLFASSFGQYEDVKAIAGAATVTRMSERSAASWDEASRTFDQAADHGLRDPAVHSAWAALLTRILPSKPSRVVDLGCGTGTLSILAADLGHAVDGVDFSEQMLAVARTKAAGRPDVRYGNGDAAQPDLAPAAYDVVMCRHVLWALPDPLQAVIAWSRLLRRGGLLVLLEGRWFTGVGISEHEMTTMLADAGFAASIEPLEDPRYWGAPISDDRYVAVARREKA